ncbi:TPA: hypothetical protein RQJ76_003898, partial [Vibrio vulnificus]|nr:hypothetical protein [Vibrio vulnificus]HDY7562536.1 hypothetical protein [Vibrio vulnificus]
MKNLAKKIGIAVAATLATSSAFADTSAIATAINGAVTTGQSNYSLVVVG